MMPKVADRPARKRGREHEDHVHAGNDDDAGKQQEEEPEIFAVGHVSCSRFMSAPRLHAAHCFKRLQHAIQKGN
jgi:hypothetical protein